jgi:DNA repair photolyase
MPDAVKRGVVLVEMPVKEIINRCPNRRLPFEWTINPYRGCEFGCVYCYARYTHEFLELRDPLDFERRIFFKTGAAQALTNALSRGRISCSTIALGTATDPYQPAERQLKITRSLLEVFASVAGLSLSITTKSHLIVRDLDLLRAIASRSKLSVNFSLITLNRRLQRMLEPRAPRPALRLRALAALSGAGICCNLLVMPVIPGLTDDERALEGLIRNARRAGARQVWWRSLFLKPAAARRFLPFVRSKLPHIAPDIERLYGSRAYAPGAYDERLGETFRALKLRYGFVDEDRRTAMSQASEATPQFALFECDRLPGSMRPLTVR